MPFSLRRLMDVCWFLIGLSPAWGRHYVRTGSEIVDCNMKCPGSVGVLELYRNCGGRVEPLLERYCYNQHYKSYKEQRLLLNPSSGCWTLRGAAREDSCVYETELQSSPIAKLSSQEFLVLDPVLIANITSNGTQLGEDFAVRVHYSGEESAVAWELEGESLPEGYQLIDGNRTLIIPSVQREDGQRRFRVRITNPVSEDTRDYQLMNDSTFTGMLEKGGSDSHNAIIQGFGLGVGLGVGLVGLVLIFILACVVFRKKIKDKLQAYRKTRGGSNVERPENLHNIENGCVLTRLLAQSAQNGAVPLPAQNGLLPLAQREIVDPANDGPGCGISPDAGDSLDGEDLL